VAIGFSSGSGCYVSASEAIDAHYSAVNPVLAAVSNSVVLRQKPVKTGSSWFIQTDIINPTNGAWTDKGQVLASTNVIGSCTTFNSNSSNFTDGVLLGWGILAAMVAAWSITVLRRAI